MSIVYLQEACVCPDRQVKLWCICDEQDVAVYVNGGSDWPEEEGEDVAWLVWGNDDGCAEVLYLKWKEKKWCRIHRHNLLFLWSLSNHSGDTHIKHGFGLFGQWHIVYSDGKAERICEEDGSVHGVDRAVPDVEQCSRVVEAQVAVRRGDKPENNLRKLKCS